MSIKSVKELTNKFLLLNNLISLKAFKDWFSVFNDSSEYFNLCLPHLELKLLEKNINKPPIILNENIKYREVRGNRKIIKINKPIDTTISLSKIIKGTIKLLANSSTSLIIVFIAILEFVFNIEIYLSERYLLKSIFVR